MGSNVGSGGVDMCEKVVFVVLVMMEDGGGGIGVGEVFYKYRDKFLNFMLFGYSDDGNKLKRYGYCDSEFVVVDVLGEKFWRKVVYGDVEILKFFVVDFEDEGLVCRRRRVLGISIFKLFNEIDMEDIWSFCYR